MSEGEEVRAKPAASAAVFRGGAVLIVQRGAGALKGMWSLPGGHIEAGETARAAALREVNEETGVTAEAAGLVDVHDALVQGDRLAAYAKTNAQKLGIDYIIWYQRIWSVARASEGWRPMENRGSATENHMMRIGRRPKWPMSAYSASPPVTARKTPPSTM